MSPLPPSSPSEGSPRKRRPVQPGQALRPSHDPGEATTASPQCRNAPSPGVGTRPKHTLQPHRPSAHSAAPATAPPATPLLQVEKPGLTDGVAPHVLLGLRRPTAHYAAVNCRSARITDNNAHCPICCLLAVRRVCRVPSAGFHGHPRSIDATAPQGEPRFHSRRRVRKQSRGSAEELAHGHMARQRRSRHLRRVCLSGPASLVFIRGWFERGLIYFV